ncbi:hypothetical protein K474DRAFT_1657767 [Panus rudis PR-1116 ss-1]|nr:hypothetical protein K474DRAFT_1657767 [Panus rudis PR-1116 ss-1]
MSRLASFRGPSTPTSSPVQQTRHPSAPNSPSRAAESTYHRKTRSILQDIRSVTETWDDIVLVDGLKAAKALVDLRTDLDNELSLVPAGSQPDREVVGPKLSEMEKRVVALDSVLVKLKKQFNRLNTLVDNLEGLLHETSKTKGWEAVQEPLWVTWSLEKFASEIPDILIPYHRSLQMHMDIVELLRTHSVPFDLSRDAITRWVSQPFLEEDGWEAKWEDLCEAEIERWNSK